MGVEQLLAIEGDTVWHPDVTPQFLATEYASGMESLRYLKTPLHTMHKVRSDEKNLPLYYLAMFSRHERAYEFWELLAKGVVSSAAFQVQFKSAALRLEIRNLIMGRGETESIPTPSRVLLEVRQGGVTTTINQEKLSRSQGDFWVVDKGSIFTIQNFGEVAVLRAIYIFEGSR